MCVVPRLSGVVVGWSAHHHPQPPATDGSQWADRIASGTQPLDQVRIALQVLVADEVVEDVLVSP